MIAQQFSCLWALIAMLDEITLLRFRRLLETHDLTQQIFAAGNYQLATTGLYLKEDAMVGATIIAAQPSKNKSKSCDSDWLQGRASVLLDQSALWSQQGSLSWLGKKHSAPLQSIRLGKPIFVEAMYAFGGINLPKTGGLPEKQQKLLMKGFFMALKLTFQS